MKSSKINNKQKALLHIAASALGVDQDLYKEILETHGGVKSSADLTPAGFEKVMRHFKSCGFKYQHNKKPQKNNYGDHLNKWKEITHRPGMATPSQLAMIDTLWDGLEWYWNKDGQGKRDRALSGLLFTRFHRSHPRLLTFSDGSKVIDALKAIQKRKTKEKKDE